VKNLLKKILFCILYFKYINFRYYFKTIFLGSNYGGWAIYNNINLYRSTVISAGLGEDASFDLELSSKYNCKILFIDPTPRSITHYYNIKKNINKKRKINYPKNTGNMPIESYDLSKIKKSNLLIAKYALWKSNKKKLKFYMPDNNTNVSHSLIYKRSKYFINVVSISLKKIIERYKIKKIELLKMDIEGSENIVIKNMIKDRIFPNQILIEIEDLHKINLINLKKFNKLNNLLIKNGYIQLYTKMDFPNLLYVKNL